MGACRKTQGVPLCFAIFYEILENRLLYSHSESMDSIDFRKMQGWAWELAAGRPAGRPRPTFPYPPLGFIGFPEILDNPLRYVHSKSMDFIDFHEFQGGAGGLAAGPAGRLGRPGRPAWPAGPAGIRVWSEICTFGPKTGPKR